MLTIPISKREQKAVFNKQNKIDIAEDYREIIRDYFAQLNKEIKTMSSYSDKFEDESYIDTIIDLNQVAIKPKEYTLFYGFHSECADELLGQNLQDAMLLESFFTQITLIFFYLDNRVAGKNEHPRECLKKLTKEQIIKQKLSFFKSISKEKLIPPKIENFNSNFRISGPIK